MVSKDTVRLLPASLPRHTHRGEGPKGPRPRAHAGGRARFLLISREFMYMSHKSGH